MKAARFHQHGGPEVLRYEDAPEPKPNPGEVLVRVKACALNHLDIWVRQGIPAYQVPLPHIGGCDVAGVVERVGDEGTDLKPGDRVFVAPGLSCWRCEFCLGGQDNLCISYRILGAQVDGGLAEFVKVPALNVIPIPSALSFEQTAAFPLTAVTAWHMLFGLARLQPGKTEQHVPGGDRRQGERRGLLERERAGDWNHVEGWHLHELRQPTVHLGTEDAVRDAEVVLPAQAELAPPAREPRRDEHAVARF